MSENTLKFPEKFQRVESDIFDLPDLSHQQRSKTQIYSVYDHIRVKKHVSILTVERKLELENVWHFLLGKEQLIDYQTFFFYVDPQEMN